MIKERFRVHLAKRTCLTESDLSAAADLMNNGFSFQDALAIAETKENRQIVHAIQLELAQGKEGENILLQYLPEQYAGYFAGFIQYMSMKDTLTAVLAIQQSEKKQKEEIIRGMLYPSLLFIGVNTGVLIFNAFVFPVMMQMMSSFSYQDPSIQIVQKMVSFAADGVLILLGISILLMLVFLQKKHIVSTYRWIQQKKEDALLVKFASADFIRFYLACMKRGIATKEALSILKDLKQKPLVSEIASQLDASLQEGMELAEAAEKSTAESALVRIFHIAVYASNCQELLQGYLNMVSQRTEHEIQVYARMVQLFSYSAVAAVIVSVYQVLLMPIQMMQTL
ncbi:MAG: type II secretion system F family protein [Solobacterium sp.]|nr:type II secretion system F family protein [Solobacterium sp.]MCH4205215.1 type II secretion system F family protein [Solobacterium sp.]MCH4226808.1 type II secretion system F family protein [Solobacterium sp.]MCH4281568.1 type II secretion system F family protein [Solobacterium sp.]